MITKTQKRHLNKLARKVKQLAVLANKETKTNTDRLVYLACQNAYNEFWHNITSGIALIKMQEKIKHKR